MQDLQADRGAPYRAARSAYRRLGAAFYSVGSGRSCNLCGWQGRRFSLTGRSPNRRSDAKCWACGSLERHRLAYALLRDRVRPGQQTLHVAPEPAVTPWLRSISDEYLSVDLEPGQAMEVMDLTDLPVEDDRYTLVYCSHVLEHIPDDAAAMREMRRVLQPGGYAVVQVPIRDGGTDEDPSITDPEERLRRFDQIDHVRLYGLDIVERLQAAGFRVETLDDSRLKPEVVARERLAYRSTRQVFLASIEGSRA